MVLARIARPAGVSTPQVPAVGVEGIATQTQPPLESMLIGPPGATPTRTDVLVEASTGIDWLPAMVGLASLLVILLVWLIVRASVSHLPAPAVVKDGFGAFAIIYVIAQAIERFLEPFSHLDPINKTREQERDRKVASASDDPTKNTVAQAADAQASLDSWQQVRMFVLWAVATVAGMILSAKLGVYFLTMVMTSNLPDRSLDVLVTGIVVGGGSKALHDLIVSVQQAKEDKTTPAEKR